VTNSENSKRIVKNTGMMYVRMLLIMAVSLYTSRIVLNTLGVIDFGVYNVVGGIVMMFSFLNSSMSSATQRFLSFELGKRDYVRFSKVFSMSVNIHSIIAILIFILAETIGLWFLNAKLVVPAERMVAANWVYQFSVFAIMLSIMNVPYNAVIIAFERMDVYAYISIVEVVLKLMIVFALEWIGLDKLKLYSALVFCVGTIVFFIYRIYSKRNFSETNYHFFWDKPLFVTLMNYAGWNLFGNIAAVTMGQGINIMLNLFMGPAVNAARAIAFQVNSAVSGFVSNFQLALNPQIVKSYAAEDLKYMHQLIFQGSKYSFFLFFAISLPIILETEYILKIWLKVVPEYTIIFTQLVILNILIDTLSGPLITAAQASGKIKVYQGVIGGLLLFILPVSYIFLKNGFEPQITHLISIVISLISFIIRLIILKKLVQLKITDFLFEVFLKTFLVSSFAVVLPLLVRWFFAESLQRFIIVSITSQVSAFVTIYKIGLNQSEKVILLHASKNIWNRIVK
jgi:O-antigen/teichoic acid export membrane protein